GGRPRHRPRRRPGGDGRRRQGHRRHVRAERRLLRPYGRPERPPREQRRRERPNRERRHRLTRRPADPPPANPPPRRQSGRIQVALSTKTFRRTSGPNRSSRALTSPIGSLPPSGWG